MRAWKMRPVVRGAFMDVWRCFRHLNRERFTELGLMPIQAQQVAAWLDIHGVRSLDDKGMLYELVSVLDAEFIAHRQRAGEEPDGDADSPGSDRREESPPGG